METHRAAESGKLSDSEAEDGQEEPGPAEGPDDRTQGRLGSFGLLLLLPQRPEPGQPQQSLTC